MIVGDLMKDQATNKRKNKKGAIIAEKREPEKRRRRTPCTFPVYPRERQGHMLVDLLPCRCQEVMDPRPALQGGIARRRMVSLREFQLRVVMALHPALMSDTPLRRTVLLLAFRSHAAKGMVEGTKFRLNYLGPDFFKFIVYAYLHFAKFALRLIIVVESSDSILTVHSQHFPDMIYVKFYERNSDTKSTLEQVRPILQET